MTTQDTLLNTPGPFYNGDPWRAQERVFIGEAAKKFAGSSWLPGDSGSSWLSDPANGPTFLGTNARLLVTTDEDGASGMSVAVVGAAKTGPNTSSGAIGVSGAVVNLKAGATGWGLYSDLTHGPGANQSFGLEVAAKNKAANTLLLPHGQTPGVYGIWLAGGGDDAYGGAPVSPSTAGVVVLKNKHTWNAAMVVMEDALTDGRAFALSSVASHRMDWYNAANQRRGAIWSSALSDDWVIRMTDGALNISRNGSLAFAALTGGQVQFGAYTAGVNTVKGYISIKDVGGTVRRLAVV